MDKKRGVAARIARQIGCQGTHQNDKGEWLPCASQEELMRVSNAAEHKLPEGLKSEEPPCLGCKEAERNKRGGRHKKRWEKFRERGVMGMDTLPDGGIVSAPIAAKQDVSHRERVVLSQKVLNDRQEAIYSGLESVVEKYGKFGWDTGPDGSHYTPADKNPFIKENLVCSNCAFWIDSGACEIVGGKIEPNAICKFWVIDEIKLNVDQQKALRVDDIKKLGPSLRRGGKPKPEAVDVNAVDGDNDGILQDGTTAERPAIRVPLLGVRRDAMGSASGNLVQKYHTNYNYRRQKIDSKDIPAVDQHFAAKKQEVLAKRNLKSLESLSKDEIHQIIKKEFPNTNFNRFVWDTPPKPENIGHAYALLIFADALDQNDPVRKSITYFDTDGGLLYSIAQQHPEAKLWAGVCGTQIGRDGAVQSISLKKQDISSMKNGSITFTGMYMNRKFKDIQTEVAKGKLTKEQASAALDEARQVAAASLAFHELGHALHNSRRQYEPLGLSPTSGITDLARRIIPKEKVDEYIQSVEKIVEEEKKLLPPGSQHAWDTVDKEEIALNALFDSLNDSFNLMGGAGWADSFPEDQVATLRDALGLHGSYASAYSMQDAQNGIDGVMYEGVAEWFSEYMTAGKTIKLNDKQQLIINELKGWLKIK